ncbi:hypothetical protein LB572_06195 [Mesorhizobium sp. BH1-1-5]|uniref:hypothetical protein n=1 Tax=Mesorhizobium sp. BH1-1-5 TaxID=2876661 RepID=UPI001CCCA6E5|nr:hypothetical protein [Mesorhizobium sp. BH1-1-5]MBZ9986685.1 hypothetical protein [Mesorhizobium sp. BH1-1-5]
MADKAMPQGSMRRAARHMQKVPGRVDATVELRSKNFGLEVFEAVVDKSLDASPQQGKLHLPRVDFVGFAHDGRDVIGDDRVAKTGQERARPCRRHSDCFLDIHVGAPHQKMLGASPADGDGIRRFFSHFGSRKVIARGQNQYPSEHY